MLVSIHPIAKSEGLLLTFKLKLKAPRGRFLQSLA